MKLLKIFREHVKMNLVQKKIWVKFSPPPPYEIGLNKLIVRLVLMINGSQYQLVISIVSVINSFK